MTRPDPDQLLAELQSRDTRTALAPLKVWFGASPGVGKTYAMLTTAQEQHAAGRDLLVGVVESHGRRDTAALLEGLPQLPMREADLGKGVTGARELDLDAALARHPQILLVDELAHSNLPGSRHPKRWQDVAELRAAGIEVWTTVNVQHLESLNDVVGGITGVRVRETVPDQVFDDATQIVLVDLPPEELLARLKAGKVYLPEAAERAQQNFFRKGNLIALRELALRRTADRVDAEIRSWRRAQAVDTVWHNRESLLACVAASPHAATVVRRCARLAARLEVPWHALLVETPALAASADQHRAVALDALALAQQLGAITATVSAADPVAAACDYARQHNLGSLLTGPTRGRGRWFAARGFAARVVEHADDLVVIQIGADTADTPGQITGRDGWTARFHSTPLDYLKGLTVVAVTAALCTPLLGHIDLANIVMLFLLAVVGSAFWLGRGPAVASAVAAVLAFDVFFVAPRFSLAVSDWQYLITFGVMLGAGLLTGQLTAQLRFQGRIARSRERRTQILFETARDLSSALADEQIAAIAATAMAQAFDARAQLWVLELDEQLHPHPPAAHTDPAIARWSLEQQQHAGTGTQTLPAARARYVPLVAPMRVRGVLALELKRPQLLKIPEQQQLLETFARLLALALERVHYTTVAREALVRMESERLRNTLLNAVSHDLRTPLTVLRGNAERLAASQPPLGLAQLALARSLDEDAQRLGRLVENLLQMARLESGEVRLQRSWWPLEEVIGAALRSRRDVLDRHRIALDLPPDNALVEADPVLIEQLLCNLLENAAKYSPAATTITVSARIVPGHWLLAVSDQGPGLPPGSAETLFQKFVRGHSESSVPGIGLGLAICRSIVAAHGGSIRASQADGGGARFEVGLPQPPLPAQYVHDTPEPAP